jgi:thiol-disulfide isomerase/thioredoxin
MSQSDGAPDRTRAPTLLRRARRWGLELLLLGAGFAAINAWQTRALPRGDTPHFSLRAVGARGAARQQNSDGGTFSSAMLPGTPTLLLFWAPWCGVCRAESQNVSWLQSIVKGRARVISVATSYRNVADVRAYMAENEVDYPVLLGDAALARSFGVQAFRPRSFSTPEARSCARRWATRPRLVCCGVRCCSRASGVLDVHGEPQRARAGRQHAVRRVRRQHQVVALRQLQGLAGHLQRGLPAQQHDPLVLGLVVQGRTGLIRAEDALDLHLVQLR